MDRSADAVEKLLAIMARLRGPDGCPWDREQTLKTLRPYVLEETYEVLEAMESGDSREHCEELGDLLLQIVFQARIAEEEGRFDFADVAEAISAKLVRRHPHVFGDARVKDAEGVMRQWVALKREEKAARGGGKSVLEGVPREMPALARAERLTEKASRIGFDWPDPAGARAKVDEELRELDEAIRGGERERVEDELGDVLFAVANLARKLQLPPEEALRNSVKRFIARFEHVERELERRGVPHGTATLEEMDRLWEEAKRVLASD
ncbi:MAG TPA: nucleoside triphosphate pyrophosphohydrolase [Anaeromyxobacteraceae bacterium]|nr:nucleoside triphosphate pyrophosphohydrolase [Anaeromyxobacteraceae bacterium]